MGSSGRSGASFRDPSGFLFLRDGTLFRQVNQSYRATFDLLEHSGLHTELVEAGLLIPHTLADIPPAEPQAASLVLRPEPLSFISYPYEWSFSQLQDAALATLDIQQRALGRGLSLKDASAYNIQFRGGRPLLIDTLSFEAYREGDPWIAYRQFCQHFLAPLALMSRREIRLGGLLRLYIDGLPLDLAVRLLPWKARLNFGLLAHLYLHAASQRRFAGAEVRTTRGARRVTRTGFLGLIDNLRRTVADLAWAHGHTAWAGYDTMHNYSPLALEAKRRLVVEYLEHARPSSLWDLGANTGAFSRLASERGIATISFDVDPSAVEANYRAVRASGESNLLPLLIDLTNPSPAQGWHHTERLGLLQRGPAEAVMALALVHHLAIGNNVPLPQVAAFLAAVGRWLIIEFVPKSDSQVKRLLAAREDIFTDYDIEGFERAFGGAFELRRREPIADSERTLYLWERRSTSFQSIS
jgi:ribosomal protein L11 methylase PrmA